MKAHSDPFQAIDGMPHWANHKTAVKLLEAYKRIAGGKPDVVDAKAAMSLSAVATEAGFHRSLLNRRRYPELCNLIDEAASHKPRKAVTTLLKDKTRTNKNLRRKLEDRGAETSAMISRVVNLQLENMSLRTRVAVLENAVDRASNVRPIVDKLSRERQSN